MDSLLRARRPIRREIKALGEEIEKLSKEQNPKKDRIRAHLKLMEDQYAVLLTWNDKVATQLVMDKADDEEQDQEFAECRAIALLFQEVKCVAERLIVESKRPGSPEGSEHTFQTSGGSKRNYRLPTIQIPKFSGELKDWIGWWSQFERLHEDADLGANDKFTYLRQAMVPDTRAKDLVFSYPPSAENYPKAIESLKDRFGNKEILIDVYVRELLSLINQNTINRMSKGKENINLAQLFDQIESHLRALESMGVTTDDKVTHFLYPMVESCLPVPVLRAWQRSALKKNEGTKTKLQRLMEFLKDEVEGETLINLASQGFGSKDETRSEKKMSQSSTGKGKREKYKDELPTAMGLVTLDEKATCGFCDRANHKTEDCYQALKAPAEEVKKRIQSNKRCFVCFGKGHRAQNCRENVSCAKCGKRHHQIICNSETNQTVTNPNSLGPIPNEQDKNLEMNQTNFTSNAEVLMPTLVIGLKDREGKIRRLRAAIDTMSGSSYIKTDIVQSLKLIPKQKVIFNHAVFGGKIVEVEHLKYAVTLVTLNGTFSCTVEVYDQQQISAGIPGAANGQVLEELREYGIYLSDGYLSKMREVDLLIGVDLAGKLFTGRVLQLKSGPTAIETRFGWTVMGKTPSGKETSETKFTVNSLLNLQSPAAFWELEAIGIMDPATKLSKTEEDEIALNHFRTTVKRKDDGRYSVSLPWINGHPPLPDNFIISEKRLQSALRKLETQDKFEDYNKVFNEWLELGIIEEVPEREINKACHYLPHRPVFKPESQTTKVRPVFDASCKSKAVKGNEVTPSLNDCLVKGPNLLDQIPDLLLRFREDIVAATADIKKAFLMIEIRDEDRNFLRFLWFNQEKKMKAYRHCRVVFGVNCSPFLLNAVIEYHLKTSAPADKKTTVLKLLSSLYVDNVAGSFPTVEKYRKFKEESVSILADAKFDLRMWESNIDEDIPTEPTNVLGILWNRASDTLTCNYKFEKPEGEKITKKSILSAVARVYDPIGMLSPVVLVPKIMMQRCWDSKLKWDDEVPENVKREFLLWVDEMNMCQFASIPRYLGVPNEESSVHVFCDASELGYAAVAYLRSEKNDQVMVTFIMGRSRVAPLSKTTINRLELISCEIAARLGCTIRDALNWKDVPFVYWTDSTTARAWIKRNADWGTFVGNRVRKILALTEPAQWRHVPGKENPADLPSRGCGMKALLESSWWKGPHWLYQDPECWPNECEIENEEEIMTEVKKTVISTVNMPVEESWFNPKHCRIGTYSGLVRVVAYLLRFAKNCRSDKTERQVVSISVEEIAVAERKFLRQLQEKTKIDSTTLPFISYKDSEGILRVETKLTYREDEECFKNPIVLPGKNYVINLLIREAHKANCHAGVQFLLSKLREKFWITGGRKAIEKVIRECFTCRKFKSEHPEPKTAPLPEDRVRDAAPFEVTGIDFAGPLYLKNKKKVWIALYTCAVYRAIHLELVNGLSTEVFLRSLRRFISRRGRPAVIYTDNGTNFTGAQRLLRELDWKRISEESSIEPIKWIFSPPSAPWWGGWWERLVRTIKELLVRVLGKRVVEHEELETILCDVESVVNGRPLTHVYEGDNLVALTPSLFLNGVRESGVPDLDRLQEIGFGKRFQLKQRLMEDLRQRFRKEYLGQLVQRKKDEKNLVLKPGDVVLIGSDGKKRVLWPTGVIEELIPGRDGICRVAKVRAAHGVLSRPIQRLYPLEIPSRDGVEIPEEKIGTVLRTKRGRAVKKPDRLGY